MPPGIEGNTRLGGTRHTNDRAEDIAPRRLDALQELPVDLTHDLGGNEAGALVGRKRSHGARVEHARARGMMLEHRTQSLTAQAAPGVLDLVLDVGVGAAETGQVLCRQVHPAAAEIHAHVTQDVRQLQGDTEVPGVVANDRIAIAEDANAHEPDRRGHAVAVRFEIREGLVPAGGRVHGDSIHQRIEVLTGQIERADERLQDDGPRASRVRGCRTDGRAPRARRRSPCRPASVVGARSTLSSTARQKSQTATMACRLAFGSARNA